MESNHHRQEVPDDLPRENPLKLFISASPRHVIHATYAGVKDAQILSTGE